MHLQIRFENLYLLHVVVYWNIERHLWFQGLHFLQTDVEVNELLVNGHHSACENEGYVMIISKTTQLLPAGLCQFIDRDET